MSTVNTCKINLLRKTALNGLKTLIQICRIYLLAGLREH